MVEASCGSTAISEAYFARLLGLPFIAVVPRSTSPEKIAAIEFYGGELPPRRDAGRDLRRSRPPRRRDGRPLHGPVHLRRARDRLARQQQHRREPSSRRWRTRAPRARAGSSSSAGTGGTSATIGRYIRYRRHADAAVRRRSREFGVLRLLPHRRPRPRFDRARASRASAARASSRRS